MRVALLSTSYPRHAGDAAGHFVEAEASALAAEGHDVTVIAPGRSGATQTGAPRVCWIDDGGAFGWPGALTRLRENPPRAIGAWRFARRAARALRELGPFDRVTAHFLVPCGWPIAGEFFEQSAGELEIVVHGSDARLFARLPLALRRHVAARLAGRGARLRCVSEELRRELAESGLGVLAEKAEVAPPPIAIPSLPSRAATRRALGIGALEPLVVVAGRLIAGKRVDVALRALSLVPGLRVVVVGDGPERAALMRAFPDVLFTGQRSRPEALALIAAADALVSASLAEGAPTAIREARALGVPAVSLPAGDLRKWAERDPGILLAALSPSLAADAR